MLIPTTTTVVTFLSVLASSSLVEGRQIIAPNGRDGSKFEARQDTGSKATSELRDRSIASAGGWSLSVGDSNCPEATASCFSDLTGVKETSNRRNECCPIGSQPMLQCGTYVNTGQPYACCPLDNPDCRGDVETVRALNETESCANSGWALWLIPDGGYNRFCCLPGQYGYWYRPLGQDAVGQCSNSSILPEGAVPGQQVNNGDGTVDHFGYQTTALNYTVPEPAPTCDIISRYGWSLQINGTNTGGCTAGSHQCSNYAGACCPRTLDCGTVIGDAEVPVCCPPSNPDCRGDVEGLWPQVCADSSWSLWHVNTNGNHFCCKPHEIGWNVVDDVYALGYCGTHVPVANNTMRAILDYVGDGSIPGSSYAFPCDSTPAPNATLMDMLLAIIDPAFDELNPSDLLCPLYPDATEPVLIDASLSLPIPGLLDDVVQVVDNLIENFGYDNGGSMTLTRTSTAAVPSATGEVLVTVTALVSSGVVTTVTEMVPTEVATVLAKVTSLPVWGGVAPGIGVDADIDVDVNAGVGVNVDAKVGAGPNADIGLNVGVGIGVGSSYPSKSNVSSSSNSTDLSINAVVQARSENRTASSSIATETPISTPAIVPSMNAASVISGKKYIALMAVFVGLML